MTSLLNVMPLPFRVWFLFYQALASYSYLVATLDISSVALSDLFGFLLQVKGEAFSRKEPLCQIHVHTDRLP